MEFESTLDISPESVKQMMLAALGNISNIVLAATAHPILGVLAFVLSRIVQEVWLKQETLSKIENSITEVFREQLNSSIRDAILPQLLAIRMVAISQIKHGTISKIEAELMRRHSATEIDFGKSQVERDQIATACRREREDLIVPLRMRMESFKAETEALI
jgi:phosphate/sulfate permease